MKRPCKTAVVYCLFIFSLMICVKFGSQAVTTFSENRAISGKYCIVIDPGHGGEDGGAISRSGLPESKYNLEIALRLKDLFHLLGHHTKMTRTADVSIYTKGETLSQKKASDLKERVKLINETENALLISIHQNHYPDDRYSGAQVFYADTAGSEELAKLQQAALLSALDPGNNRQIKRIRGVYLMEHIQCPAVLIECGFLSNASEDEKLKDPEYQKKLSCAIAAATCQYLSNT